MLPPRIPRKSDKAERGKRLRDPLYWEHNATLMRDPDFARISRNYARKLREQE